MVTSKKAPARKIAKRVRTAKVNESGAAKGGLEVNLEPVATSVPLEKQKLVRDSFTMPKRDYDQIGALKARLLKLEHAIKKGELLRAGLSALTAMTDADLLTVVVRIQRLKTGRPEKSAQAGKVATKKKG